MCICMYVFTFFEDECIQVLAFCGNIIIHDFHFQILPTHITLKIIKKYFETKYIQHHITNFMNNIPLLSLFFSFGHLRGSMRF